MIARRAIALEIAGGRMFWRTFSLTVLATVLATFGPILAGSGLARANMAFPTSLQILLPADRPAEIALATNFGLMLSEDGGVTWEWTCEQQQTFGASSYAVGPAPQDRFYAMSMTMGLFAYSDDVSCTWTLASGTVGQAAVTDYFPDPRDANRVLALATTQQPGGTSAAQLFASSDGGATFGAALYTAPATGNLRGVEIARSDPMTIYLSLYTTTQVATDGGTVFQYHPRLVRSTDGGATFTSIDVEPLLGRVQLGIMGVDPTDARTVYLRVIDIEQNQERVAISRDGGLSFTTPVTVPGGVLTAFARLESGTLLVGATAFTVAMAFRSADGGASFQPWTGVPHIEALAERGGKLYVAAKNYTDGWALGVSSDEGVTIQPIVTYDKVRAIKACVRDLPVCMDSCESVASRQIWSPAVCGDNVTPPPTPKNGCGCALGVPRRAGAIAVVLVAAAALLSARARRRRGGP